MVRTCQSHRGASQWPEQVWPLQRRGDSLVIFKLSLLPLLVACTSGTPVGGGALPCTHVAPTQDTGELSLPDALQDSAPPGTEAWDMGPTSGSAGIHTAHRGTLQLE